MHGIIGKDPFYAEGLRFSCTRCSACCRYESGYVFLTEKDAAALCTALSMSREEFIEVYCRWIPSINGNFELSLKEKSNRDCIFWKTSAANKTGTENSGGEGGCSVYGSRPLQCRAFPFWPAILSSVYNWKMSASGCPGMDSGTLHSKDSIEKWLALEEDEPIILKD